MVQYFDPYSFQTVSFQGGIMRDFLRNLAILVVIFIGFMVLFPDMMNQVGGLMGGLGILPLFIIMVIISAIPKRKRR